MMNMPEKQNEIKQDG